MNRFVACSAAARTRRGSAAGAVAVALICAFAAGCSTAGGKRIVQSGTYRTGPVGTALSNAAARGSAELARTESRLRADARPAAAGAAARKPRRAERASAPAPVETPGAQAATSRSAALAARPALESGADQQRDAAQRALTRQTILAPALAEARGVSAGAARAAAPVNRALAGWSLSRPQLGVLTLGLLLAILAAGIAAWSAGRRRRAMSEPRIAEPAPAREPALEPAPEPANDTGGMEWVPTRAAGPQYVLPLSPAGAPRSYSLKAGGAAKLVTPRR